MDTSYFRREVLALLVVAYVTTIAASVIGQAPTSAMSSTEVTQKDAWGGRLPVYPVLTNYHENNSTLWSVALSPPFIRRSRRPMPTPPPAEPSEEDFDSPETTSSEDAETNDVSKSSTPASARHVTGLRFPQPSVKRKIYNTRQLRTSTTTTEPTTTPKMKILSISTVISEEGTSSEEEFQPYPPPTPNSGSKTSLGEVREPKMTLKNQVIDKTTKSEGTTTGRSMSTPDAPAKPASKYANMRKYFRTKPTTTTSTTSTTPLPADEESDYEDDEEEEEPTTTTTTTTTTKRPTTTRRLTKFRTKAPPTKRTTTTTTTTTTPTPRPKPRLTTRTTTARTTTSTTTTTTTTRAPTTTTSTTTSTPIPTLPPSEGSANPVLDDSPFVGEVSAVGPETSEALVSESNYAVGSSSSEVGASEKDHWGQAKEAFVADMEMDEAQMPGEATYLV